MLITDLFEEKISINAATKAGSHKEALMHNIDTFTSQFTKGKSIIGVDFRSLLEFYTKFYLAKTMKKKILASKRNTLITQMKNRGLKGNVEGLANQTLLRNLDHHFAQEISDLIKSFNKGSHNLQSIKSNDKRILKFVNISTSFCDKVWGEKIEFEKKESIIAPIDTDNSVEFTKEDIHNIEVTSEFTPDEKPSIKLMSVGHNQKTDDFKYVKGWIKQVSSEVDISTGRLSTLILITPFKRGYGSSNRLALSIFTNKDVKITEGLTYNIKYTKKDGVNQLIELTKWEKTAEWDIMIKMIKKHSLIDGKYLLNTASAFIFEDDKLKVPNRLIKKTIKKEDRFGKFLLELDIKLAQNNVHWVSVFTGLDSQAWDIMMDVRDNNRDLFTDTDLNLSDANTFIMNLLKSFGKFEDLAALRIIWSKDKFYKQFNEAMGIPQYSWNNILNPFSLRNPYQMSFSYRQYIFIRMYSSNFNALNRYDKITSLLMRAIVVEETKANSSVVQKTRINAIMVSIYKTIKYLGFDNELIRNIANSSDEYKVLQDNIELFDELRYVISELDADAQNDFFVDHLDSRKLLIQDTFNGEDIMYLQHADSNVHMEKEVANKINKFNTNSNSNIKVHEGIFERNNLDYDEGQHRAIQGMFDNNLSMLIGKAGSGKTTTIKMFIDKYVESFPGRNIIVATPTGIAALVLKQKMKDHPQVKIDTIFSKSTLHDVDVLIIEESSMVATFALKNLLLKYGAAKKIIFAGDTGQLPSIGLGNVLDSLDECKPFTQNRFILEKNHRQSGNDIYRISNLIRDYNPENENIDIVKEMEDSEYFDVHYHGANKHTKQKFLNEIVNNDSFYEKRNTIITSRNFGYLGTQNINDMVQIYKDSTILTKDKFKTELENYSIGSKVMFLSNTKLYGNSNNKKPLFLYANGDIATITDIVETDDKIDVHLEFKHINGEDIIELLNIDRRTKAYSDTLDTSRIAIPRDGELSIVHSFNKESESVKIPFVLSFASTIHKSQGTEFDIVHLVIEKHDDSSYAKLSNQHIYTAVTRAKRRVVVHFFSEEISESDDGISAKKNFENIISTKEKRLTLLKRFLEEPYIINKLK